MEFTLTYDGDLPPNGSKAAKWEMRTQFDKQMRRLWEVPPLSGASNYVDQTYKPETLYLGRRIKDIEFVSPVSAKIKTCADLDIRLLSAGEGQSFTLRGGDIDNRMKTLLDALRAPTTDQEVPVDVQTPDDGRVYCLLDDDKLVSRLTIKTGRLLTENGGSNRTLVLIEVRLKASEGHMGNLSIVV